MATFLGATEKEDLTDVTIIDNTKIEDVESTLSSNPQIHIAMETFISYLVGSGMELVYKKFDKKQEMSHALQRAIEREVIPFMRVMIARYLYHGFVVYTGKKSECIELNVPNHPRLQSWTAIFGYCDDVREYRVLRNDAMGSVSNKAYSQEEVFEGAHISVLYPPDDKGNLKSPLAILYPHMCRLNNYWNDIDETSGRLARPEFVVESRIGGVGNRSNMNPDPIITSRYADDDIPDIYQESTMRLNHLEQEQLKEARMIADLQRKGHQVVTYNPMTQRQEKRNVGNSWDNPFKLPSGQQVARPTMPQVISQIDRIIDMILKTISGVVGVSQHTQVHDSGRYHSANTEIDLRELNDRIRSFQSFMIPQVEEMFETLWREQLEQDRYSTISEMYKDTKITEKDVPDIKHAKKQIYVEVSFNYTPLTSYDRLVDLRNEGIINQETFSMLAIKLTGLDPSVRASTSEQQQILEKRKRVTESIDNGKNEETKNESDSKSKSEDDMLDAQEKRRRKISENAEQ